MKTLFALALVTVVLWAAPVSRGAPVYEVTIPLDMLVETVPFAQASPAFSFSVSQLSDDFQPVNPLFEGVRFSQQVVGQTFRATADNDPDFAGFVSRITDGVDDTIWRTFSTTDPSGQPAGRTAFGNLESTFWRLPRGTDLAGSDVTAVTLRLDSLSIVPSGEPAAPRYVASFTLAAEGNIVPEPGALGVLGLMLVALSRRRGSFRG